MSELLKKILDRNNMDAGCKRVGANKGVGGVDGVTVEELSDRQRAQCSLANFSLICYNM